MIFNKVLKNKGDDIMLKIILIVVISLVVIFSLLFLISCMVISSACSRLEEWEEE